MRSLRRALVDLPYWRVDLPPGTFTRTTDEDPTSPIVSVVVPTFNRSNTLRYALESLVAQTVTDWEALVVGDHCTDDTETVVGDFGDARIQWINLDRNMGEQSGPNSLGARLARGEYIAWLNHDDLWFPDHLETLIRVGEDDEADFVASAWLDVGPHSEDSLMSGTLEAGAWFTEPGSQVDLYSFHPASTWLVRRELVHRVGDWKPATTLRGIPSQDYVYRCWAAGARMRLSTRATVVAIQSGRFNAAYSRRLDAEHQAFSARMAETTAEALLQEVTRNSRADLRSRLARGLQARRLPSMLVRVVTHATLVPLLCRLGVGPHESMSWIQGFGKGERLRDLGRRRGLSKE